MNYVFFHRPALVFSLASLTLLTSLEVPIFVTLFCVVLWVWKWLSDMQMVQALSRKTTTVLSLFYLSYIFLEYRNFWTQESSSALLVGLSSLKIMDYANRRDHLSVVLLGFLLLTLKPLYGFDLYWLPIQIVCMLSLWWALSQDPKKIPRRVLGMVFAVSLPITLLLFLIFPRIVLPWALSQSKGGSARMGFSSDLNPGQIAELATSTDLVFRVQFRDQNQLDPREMYWKGGLLSISEGLSWKTSTHNLRRSYSPIEEDQSVIPYEIILEPGAGNVVFTLDPTYSLKSPDGPVAEFKHFIWRSQATSNKSQRFFAKSQFGALDREWPTANDLQIGKLPPQTSQWIEETKQKYKDTSDRRRALHQLFKHPDFTYTLTPGVYDKEKAMDEFLFERRRGFCEHFAGAYATLSRALGIPARVVGGYQGAEYNALGEFWRVTQRQAHAWVEIWNGKNWERQDPTLWVARSEYSRMPAKSFFAWIDEATSAYEALNFRWTNFLIDFDQNAQKLALREWLSPILMTSVLILIVMFFFKLIKTSFFSSKNQLLKVRQNQLSLLVQQIKERIEDFEDRDLSHLPPLEILRAAEKSSKETSSFYSQVADLYDRAFYQEKTKDADLKSELQVLQKKWVEIQVLEK